MKENISNEKINEQSCKTDVKCRFFAQYYGTETFCGGDNHIITNVEWYTISDESYPNPHLKLKPLSKITDEDAILMYRGLERNYESSNQFLEDYKSIGFLEQSEVDFLRSKGYAVPYMEYSVDELVKMGWVQLA